MSKLGGYVREAVIPDIQVKILNLCLSDDENGILLPITQRKSISLEYRADFALRSVISEKINKKQVLPLILRKKQLYEKAIKEKFDKEKESFENLFCLNTVPIFMRKHRLSQTIRAG